MIYFEAQINHEIFNKVQQIRQYIINQKHPAIIDIVPSYRAIMLSIDIAQCDVNQVVEELKLDQSDNKLEAHTRGEAKQINIPVFYGGEYGQDLNEVASKSPPVNTNVLSFRNCIVGPIIVNSMAGPSLPINVYPILKA